MKALTLLALAALCSLSALAQVEEEPAKRHRFGLQIGVAFPLDDFKESSFEDPYPSFALEGILLSGTYRYILPGPLSAGASLRLRHHRFDEEKLGNGDGGLELERSSEAWVSTFIMADVYLNLVTAENAKCYVSGSLGASFNRSASWELNTKYGDIRMPADKATALALGWGGGLEFYPAPLVVVNLEAGALYTRPEFTVPDTKGVLFQHKLPMHSVFVQVGTSYTF